MIDFTAVVSQHTGIGYRIDRDASAASAAAGDSSFEALQGAELNQVLQALSGGLAARRDGKLFSFKVRRAVSSRRAGSVRRRRGDSLGVGLGVGRARVLVSSLKSGWAAPARVSAGGNGVHARDVGHIELGARKRLKLETAEAAPRSGRDCTERGRGDRAEVTIGGGRERTCHGRWSRGSSATAAQ